MLILLAIPVVVSVALAHRVVQTVAPSSILIARARAVRPTLLRGGGLGALGLVLIAVGHGLTMAIAGGAPGWLNLVVLVLLWDSMRIMLVAVIVATRAALAAVHPVQKKGSAA